MPRCRILFLVILLMGLLGSTATPSLAQHGGGGGGRREGGIGRPMDQGPGAQGVPDRPGFAPGGIYARDNGGVNPNRAPESAGTVGGMRSKTQLGLLGRWWDDKHFAKDLKLRPEQQQHMDSIFESSRPALSKSLQDYQGEQAKLNAMYRSTTLDENTLYAQIDRVSQARAELGKAYTHFMLQIRGEMEPEQISILDASRPKQP